ncbi:MAG: regulatory protein RecX [Ruminococcaceae bacterium]|nr:regulatory protein RecX [Oscillospiraceae bacterium]
MIDCRNYVFKLIEFRDRTEKELRGKLLEKGYDENIIEDEIAFLKDYGYINDARYAQRFVSDAVNLKKWGKIRIRTELLRKGVQGEIVDNAIEDAFCEESDDRLFDMMQKRFKDSDFGNIKERNRIFNFYMRRGFTPDEIKGAMNRMCSFDDIMTDEY